MTDTQSYALPLVVHYCHRLSVALALAPGSFKHEINRIVLKWASSSAQTIRNVHDHLGLSEITIANLEIKSISLDKA